MIKETLTISQENRKKHITSRINNQTAHKVVERKNKEEFLELSFINI